MSAIQSLDCGALAIIQGIADRIWADNRARVDYVPFADAALALLANQTAQLSELQSEKDNIVNVEWLETCGMTDAACTDDCDFDGSEASPVCKSYQITDCREVAWQVEMKEFRGLRGTAEEYLAKQKLKAMKVLAEYAAAQIAAGFAANIDHNDFAGIGVVGVDDITTIGSGYWNISLMGYLAQVAKMNKMKNPYIMDGNNLYQAIWQTQNSGLNDNKPKLGAIPYFSDPFNLESAAPLSTFLTEKTAFAYITKAYYAAYNAGNPFKVGTVMKWSEALPQLPGVSVDIIHYSECVGNKDYFKFKAKINGLFAVNPNDCGGKIGNLQFKCA